VPDLTTHLTTRRRIDVQLSTGLRVSYHLPDSRRCLIRAEERQLITRTVETDRLWRSWYHGRELIAEALEAVDGFEVRDHDRLALVDLLTPLERSELLAHIDEGLAEGLPQPDVIELHDQDQEPASWDEAAAVNRAAWRAGVG
jgi:hypothetical protein